MIKHYIIKKKIGQGGFGKVFKALKQEDNNIYALKKIPIDQSNMRLYREVNTLKQVSHPNIVKLYDFFEEEEEKDDRYLYLVMEFINGGKTLDEQISKTKRIKRGKLVKYMSELLSATAYLHDNNIIHRDIKPSNILVSKQDSLILTDFGTAKILGNESTKKTGTKDFIGTFCYTPPEIIRDGSKESNHLTDIYSIGLIMYELLTKKFPFHKSHYPKLMQEILFKTPQSPKKYVPNISDDLAHCCMKAIDKDPTNRFQTCQEFYESLKQTQEFQDQGNLFDTLYHYLVKKTSNNTHNDTLENSQNTSLTHSTYTKLPLEVINILNEDTNKKETKAHALSILERLSSQGNTIANCYMGYCYEIGKGTNINQTKADYFYEKATIKTNLTFKKNAHIMFDQDADQLKLNAYSLLLEYFFKNEIHHKFSKDIEILIHQMTQTNPQIGNYIIGDIYRLHGTTTEDFETSISFYEASAYHGNKKGNWIIGHIALHHPEQLQLSLREIWKKYETSARQKDPHALYMTYLLSQMGFIKFQNDPLRYKELLEQSALLGYEPAIEQVNIVTKQNFSFKKFKNKNFFQQALILATSWYKTDDLKAIMESTHEIFMQEYNFGKKERINHIVELYSNYVSLNKSQILEKYRYYIEYACYHQNKKLFFELFFTNKLSPYLPNMTHYEKLLQEYPMHFTSQELLYFADLFYHADHKTIAKSLLERNIQEYGSHIAKLMLHDINTGNQEEEISKEYSSELTNLHPNILYNLGRCYLKDKKLKKKKSTSKLPSYKIKDIQREILEDYTSYQDWLSYKPSKFHIAPQLNSYVTHDKIFVEFGTLYAKGEPGGASSIRLREAGCYEHHIDFFADDWRKQSSTPPSKKKHISKEHNKSSSINPLHVAVNAIFEKYKNKKLEDTYDDVYIKEIYERSYLKPNNRKADQLFELCYQQDKEKKYLEFMYQLILESSNERLITKWTQRWNSELKEQNNKINQKLRIVEQYFNASCKEENCNDVIEAISSLITEDNTKALEHIIYDNFYTIPKPCLDTIIGQLYTKHKKATLQLVLPLCKYNMENNYQKFALEYREKDVITNNNIDSLLYLACYHISPKNNTTSPSLLAYSTHWMGQLLCHDKSHLHMDFLHQVLDFYLLMDKQKGDVLFTSLATNKMVSNKELYSKNFYFLSRYWNTIKKEKEDN